MDESPKQLIAETKTPVPASPAKHDYGYKCCGMCNIFMACEPLVGKIFVSITERKTKKDWARFLEEIAEAYSDAEKITLVMDNLHIHSAGALYETFSPEKAKTLWDRFEFMFTPKHGSWLNMAEIELNVLMDSALGGELTILRKLNGKHYIGKHTMIIKKPKLTGSSLQKMPG